MTEARCYPTLPHIGLNDLQLASILAPEAVRAGHNTRYLQHGQGMLQPVCVGVNGVCPLRAALEELRGIGEISAHDALPDKLKGCLYSK